MSTILLIVHLFVTILLIGVVLIQRSEGGGLGIGSSQGMGSFMSGRGTANLLTRATAILATIFMLLSMALAMLNKGGGTRQSILDTVPVTAPAPAPTGPSPRPAPAANAPAAPASNAPAAPAANAPAPTAPGAATPPATPESAAKTPAPAAPAAPSGPSAPTN